MSATGFAVSHGVLLGDLCQQRAALDLIPDANRELGQDSSAGRRDAVLHLHRLEHQQQLARLYPVANIKGAN